MTNLVHFFGKDVWNIIIEYTHIVDFRPDQQNIVDISKVTQRILYQFYPPRCIMELNAAKQNVNCEILINNQYITSEYIKKHIDILPPMISHYIDIVNTYREYKSIDVIDIINNNKVPEHIVSHMIDEELSKGVEATDIDWEHICFSRRDISLDFIEKYKMHICWYFLCINENISFDARESILVKYIDLILLERSYAIKNYSLTKGQCYGITNGSSDSSKFNDCYFRTFEDIADRFALVINRASYDMETLDIYKSNIYEVPHMPWWFIARFKDHFNWDTLSMYVDCTHIDKLYDYIDLDIFKTSNCTIDAAFIEKHIDDAGFHNHELMPTVISNRLLLSLYD